MTSPQTHIPARSRVAVLCLATLAVFVLAGCSNSARPAPPQASLVVEAMPMFASDEEALAAAELAYANYIEVSDQIARDGGANPERLEPYVSADIYRQQLAEYKDVQAKELRTSGGSTFDSFKIESYDEASGEIRAYVCLRTAGITVLNSASMDVTPVGRNNDLPLQVVFLIPANPNSLVSISQSDVWSGTNFC